MCVCANPIHGWRVAWGEPLVKLVCSHSWPLDAMFWVGTHRVDMVPLPSDVKLKVPLAAATAPWLLILIQSLSLQEAQERPLDSSDWMKPEEYDPDAKQVKAGKMQKNELASLSPGKEQVAFVFVNEAEIILWILASLASLWDWNANYLSIPPLVALSPSPSLPKCKALTYTTWKRDRERQHTILHLRAHKQIRQYWLEPRLHSHWCSSQ